MLNDLLSSVDKVYLAYGATDFRKQTSSLCSIVQNTFIGIHMINQHIFFVIKKEIV